MSFPTLKISIPKDEESVGSKRSYQSPVPTKTTLICPPAPHKVIDKTKRPIIRPLNFDLNINFDDFKLDSIAEFDNTTPPKIKRYKND
jgi:hypothetical protein